MARSKSVTGSATLSPSKARKRARAKGAGVGSLEEKAAPAVDPPSVAPLDDEVDTDIPEPSLSEDEEDYSEFEDEEYERKDVEQLRKRVLSHIRSIPKDRWPRTRRELGQLLQREEFCVLNKTVDPRFLVATLVHAGVVQSDQLVSNSKVHEQEKKQRLQAHASPAHNADESEHDDDAASTSTQEKSSTEASNETTATPAPISVHDDSITYDLARMHSKRFKDLLDQARKRMFHHQRIAMDRLVALLTSNNDSTPSWICVRKEGAHDSKQKKSKSANGKTPSKPFVLPSRISELLNLVQEQCCTAIEVHVKVEDLLTMLAPTGIIEMDDEFLRATDSDADIVYDEQHVHPSSWKYYVFLGLMFMMISPSLLRYM